MKQVIIAILFFVAVQEPVFCQWDYNILAGGRLRFSSFDASVEESLLSAPVLGLELVNKRYPLSVSYQYEFTFAFQDISPISNLIAENNLNVLYKIKKGSLLLGHYWRRVENTLSFFLSGTVVVSKYRGIQAGYSLPIRNFALEYRLKAEYDPDFNILGIEQHNLYFITRIHARKKEADQQDFSNTFVQVHGLVGSRFFPKQDIDLLRHETLRPVAFAPMVGVEFYFPSFHSSFNIERDWWVGLNFGSTERTVKEVINHTFIGPKYHHLLPNRRFIRIGLGASLIQNSALAKKLPPDKLNKNFSYQVKGLGLHFSHELFNNLDLELNGTIPFSNPAEAKFKGLVTAGMVYRVGEE